MTEMVEVNVLFDTELSDKELLQEAVERLRAIVDDPEAKEDASRTLQDEFRFTLPDDPELETYLRTLMEITRVTTRELTIQFGTWQDGSCIGIVPWRFEECIERALDWGRRFGDYEIKIAE